MRRWLPGVLVAVLGVWQMAGVSRGADDLSGPTNAARSAPAAAQAWQAVTNWSLLPPPMAWQTHPPTREQLDQFDDQQAALVGEAADRAREFYLHFPGDPNALPARTAELQTLQQAVHLGATNRLADLDRREQELLNDRTAPEQLRYELRLDVIGRELKARTAAGADPKTVMEKAGRGLVREFPNAPAGYEILLEVARTSDTAAARTLAELMANSGGPDPLTSQGKGLLRRLDAVGQPLAFQFAAGDGRPVNLTTLSNRVVLVDFWATWCPGCVALTPEVKELYRQFRTNGFEVVGINFDDDTNAAQKFIAEQGLAWPQYFGGRDRNPIGREYAIDALPSVWLVDRKGVVRDIHGTENLAAKMAKLMAE